MRDRAGDPGAVPGTIVRFGDLYLAGGTLFEGSPRIWSSKDGLHWDAGFLNIGNDDPVRFGVTGVASTGSEAIAIGSLEYRDPSDSRFAIWRSVDGARWEQAWDQTFSGAELWAVGATDAGYVILGSSDGGPRAWISLDGLSWQQSASPTTLGIAARVQAVLPADGDLTAFVMAEDNDAIEIWRTVGGDVDLWSRLATVTADPFYGNPTFARGPRGWLAMAGHPWASPDGITWTAAASDRALQPTEMTTLVGHEGGWVAASQYGSMSAPGGCCVPDTFTTETWMSPDGIHWERVLETLPDARINAMLVQDGRLVALGQAIVQTEDGPDRRPRIWTVDMPSVTP